MQYVNFRKRLGPVRKALKETITNDRSQLRWGLLEPQFLPARMRCSPCEGT